MEFLLGFWYLFINIAACIGYNISEKLKNKEANEAAKRHLKSLEEHKIDFKSYEPFENEEEEKEAQMHFQNLKKMDFINTCAVDKTLLHRIREWMRGELLYGNILFNSVIVKKENYIEFAKYVRDNILIPHGFNEPIVCMYMDSAYGYPKTQIGFESCVDMYLTCKRGKNNKKSCYYLPQ